MESDKNAGWFEGRTDCWTSAEGFSSMGVTDASCLANKLD